MLRVSGNHSKSSDLLSSLSGTFSEILHAPTKIFQGKRRPEVFAYTRAAKVNFWHVPIAWSLYRRNTCPAKKAFVKVSQFFINFYKFGYLNKNFTSKMPENIFSTKTLLK